MTLSGFGHSLGTGDEGAVRARVAAEMARAAVAEFIGMERSLRAAAEHLTAAEEIRAAEATEASGVTPELAAMVARVTLAG